MTTSPDNAGVYTHKQWVDGAVELRRHFEKAGVVGYGNGISRSILSEVLRVMGMERQS